MARDTFIILLLGTALFGCASESKGISTGNADYDAIDAAIRVKKAELKLCYRQAVRVDRKTQGKVLTAFVVDRDGSVKDEHIISSESGDKILDNCILGVLKEIRFASQAKPVTVKYPFTFSNTL